jgi:hypothetical protein
MINKDHPVLIDHVAEAASQYPEHEEETVRSFVMQAYRKIAISHVAHVEQFRNYPGLGKKFVNESLRNDEAMTMALLGLVSAEAMFGPSLGAKLGRKMPRQRELVKA